MSEYVYGHVDAETKRKVRTLSVIKGVTQSFLVKEALLTYLDNEISKLDGVEFESLKNRFGVRRKPIDDSQEDYTNAIFRNLKNIDDI